MQGDVTTAHLGYIVRDHDAAKFAARKAQMQHIAACLNDRYGAGTVELDIKDSYYNMLEKIQPHFHLVENARKAIHAAGLEPIETPVRGGTDGATLSYMGLPCPTSAPAASTSTAPASASPPRRWTRASRFC